MTPGSRRPDLEQLAALASDAAQEGYPIRIALIGSPMDLGSVTALWAKPQQYARFLGAEVSFAYRGRLLIVMPEGLGTYQLGHPSGSQRHALASVKVEPRRERARRHGDHSGRASRGNARNHAARPPVAAPSKRTTATGSGSA